MNDTIMPATEAVVSTHDDDVALYELAYHILPTVAEGEVDEVTAEIKSFLDTVGVTITDEENPARFELAYEIEKYLEGKYRHFASAYFGWLRFTVEPVKLAVINETLIENKKLLRHLITRLTAVEEANPFRFHEAIATLNTEVTDTDKDGTIGAEADEELAVKTEVDKTEVKTEPESDK